jgi:hypothetical protein
MFDDFVKRGYICDIVEVYAPNVLKLKDVPGIRTIYLSNILTFYPTERYDVVFFWHGIEHLEKKSLKGLITRLKSYTNKLIVFGCPYGIYKQDALYGNPYEVHVTAWYPEDLKILGLNCDTIGKRDSVRANLLSWKRL